MKKGKLRTLEGGMVSFYCPGCKEYHGVAIEGEKRPKWDFNGDFEKPTFRPSILVKSGHYVDGYNNNRCWCTYNEENPDKPAPFKCGLCHSFVTDGKIQYLSDCTHDLAGQTIELEDEEE
jgi:hypothetical protein